MTGPMWWDLVCLVALSLVYVLGAWGLHRVLTRWAARSRAHGARTWEGLQARRDDEPRSGGGSGRPGGPS